MKITVMQGLALCPGGSLAKAVTDLLNSMDSDTCYDVGPLQEALRDWEMAKPVADIHAMFERWYTDQFTGRGDPDAFVRQVPPEFFDRNEDGEYVYHSVRNYWPDFEAMVSLSHANMSVDMRRDLEQLQQKIASLQDPEQVLVNMLSGKIAKPTARGIGKLYGEAGWVAKKYVEDARVLFEKWFSEFILRSNPIEDFFARNKDGCYARGVVEGNWVAFSAALNIAHCKNDSDEPKPRYRLLEDGDKILPSDYWLLADTETWVNVGDKANSWIGAIFNGSFHHPCRRRITDGTETVE